MPLSNYSHQAVLNALLGKTSAFGALATAPTIHVGLSTSAPTMAGGNVTEPSGGDYARVSTTASDWGTATDADPSVIANAENITFPEPTDAWGTVTHAVLFDAATGGNVIGYGVLGEAQAVTASNTPRFNAGQISTRLRSPT